MSGRKNAWLREGSWGTWAAVLCLVGASALISQGCSGLGEGFVVVDEGGAPDGGGNPPDGGGNPPDGGGNPPDGGGNPPDGGTPFRFVAYGDTRTKSGDHQDIIDAIAAAQPQLVLHTGDLWDGYSAAKWKSIITSHANIAALLNDNLFLVAKGNHESKAEVLGFSPSLVRDGSVTYSFSKGGVFFVSVGQDPSANTRFLEDALKSSAALAARWRVVFGHFPVYSSGSHGASGMPKVEELCDRYNVNLFFSGHDHHYERSHQIIAGTVGDDGDDLWADNGTLYIVAGGGGAPLYSVNNSGVRESHIAISTQHYIDLLATDETMTVTVKTKKQEEIDAFTISQ